MKKILILLLVIPPVLVAAIFGYVLIKGPRMTVQHHFRAFQRNAPPPPPGTVSVNQPVELSAAAQPSPFKNPQAPTLAEEAAGSVYYKYYCVFCHGETGAGNGPVGQSYTPVPADLRLPKVAAYNDVELLRRMLTGVGHEPILERVVPPEHRWRLAQFVRTLGQPRFAKRPQGS
jgi:mono/diheme cytochrome c family protein